MYLKKADFNKKYPKHVEIAGDWNNANHVLEVAEGRFFPTDFGYVLLASVTDISGFNKTENFSPGCLMSLEVHRDKYTTNLLDATTQKWVDKQVDPSQLERLLCTWLDKQRNLENNPVEKCWKGKFNLNDSSVIVVLIEQQSNGDCSMLFTNLEYIEPNLIKEVPKSAGTGYSKGGTSYTEKQKAEQRMEFIVNQINAFVELKDDNPHKVKDMRDAVTILSALAVGDYLEFLTMYSLMSLALGTPIPLSTDLGIPYRSNKGVSDDTTQSF